MSHVRAVGGNLRIPGRSLGHSLCATDFSVSYLVLPFPII